MISAFSWQNSISLFPASLCTPSPNLPVTPGVSQLPTFAFQSPIMERTYFLGVSSRRSCRSSQDCSASSASSALLVGAQTWITVILNGLPWKRIEIILSFLRLHPRTAFQTLLLTMMVTPFLLRGSCPQYACICRVHHVMMYIQSTSCKKPGWMKHKLESRLLGEIAITSDTQRTLP